ncbi:hypothetical protein [Ideonella sp. BN130291]|uniref:hypothetical protein n=1 Tax=Ideonella sp. BN130291 TaxID=3112940 RepID=UPI002E2557D6|nr:hypothetical protein [Ideonella sp. BN130291]
MERDFASAHLSQDDFTRLAALCADDPKFPTSYKQWLALVRDGTRQALAEGRSATDIAVDVNDFAAWCERVDVHLCFDALRAYLIVRRKAGADAAGAKAGAAAAVKPSSGQEPGGHKRTQALEELGRWLVGAPLGALQPGFGAAG